MSSVKEIGDKTQMDFRQEFVFIQFDFPFQGVSPIPRHSPDRNGLNPQTTKYQNMQNIKITKYLNQNSPKPTNCKSTYSFRCLQLYCEKKHNGTGWLPKYFWKLFLGAKQHLRRFGGIAASCGPDIWILEQPRRLNLGELGNWTKGPPLVSESQELSLLPVSFVNWHETLSKGNFETFDQNDEETWHGQEKEKTNLHVLPLRLPILGYAHNKSPKKR